MTSYASGDAKWYFNAVTVSPGTSYNFRDYYKATTSTSLVAWIITTTGASQYQNIGTLPPSANWTLANFTFQTPANAKTITMFHLINSVGELQTDNYLLQQTASENDVPNNSLEQPGTTDTAQPDGWTTNRWGTNTTQFSYLNTGHTGSRSVETQMTSYTDGDAKWTYAAQPAQSGTQYKFSDFYYANIVTQVVVAVTLTDGSTQYIQLRHAEPASTWTQYSDTFTTPANTQSMSVWHIIAGVGYLITDDYSVTPYTPTAFNRGMVSLTFDDGWQSQATNALPVLNNHNAKGTFYLISSYLNTPSYLTTAQATSLQQAGNEIGSHTVDHPDLTTLNSTDLNNELAQSQQVLQAQFGPMQDFASPYGAYDNQVISAIKTYYRSHRSTDAGYNSKDNFDIYNIRTQSVLSTTTVSQINAWIDTAQHDKTWLVLVFHEVNTSGDQYSITPQNLDTVLTHINSINMPTLTVAQGINEITPQLP
ncbi:hypothetical protein KDH_61460 [Dictyobacter sp. S3.2.2.5]|uniref:NodB homology domain-containing protein n=2 Tax=Dictyobacter halimunensis TaxID=3026934 RepID=A0ABQ6G3U9_9CHLR|nr:hypothetical protein KDH_61460 [Dictyobacter sp. S3.2.2.5]